MMGNINQITACTVTFAALTVTKTTSTTGTIAVPGVRLQTDLVLSAKNPIGTGPESSDLLPYFDWYVSADDEVAYRVTAPAASDDVDFAAQDIQIVIGRFDHFIGDGL